MESSAEEYRLDMAENSVDDYYEGCREDMNKLVRSKYIQNEKNNNPGFANAWKISLSEAKNGELGKYQSAAIYMYTREPNRGVDYSYNEFNKATRDGKQAYESGRFQFYTLFFYLTVAIQQLKPNPRECVTVYRRTDVNFQTDVIDHKIRFGAFTSTSHLQDLIYFGEESCFEVYTCYGADIEQYSAIPGEREVLIPPYEIFRVTAIQQNTWCKVVYELKSEGKRSNLNCAAVQQENHDL
ncbi:NAD(P)(+)--arginine ADP-ribosyltransferase 2-like [Astyanax mexicanus]|uniref:NAD(P)(+)--arginine ADP-ribosyltransferase 2-like n=1 Tax=Astyanax mexicanus TaxID=7994 RepID=UPI0020CB530E|nr:NAD(P)(+)--arginine ADP-ribosyltransferase 2-like [Astyanax mexicanus]